MSSIHNKQQVEAILAAALECSFYIAPETPGLTHEELFEAGARLGLLQGEMHDTLHEVADVYMGMRPNDKLLPARRGHLTGWQYFIHDEDPEFRDIHAFDAVYSEWRNSARSYGARQVQLERSVVVERAVNAGIPRLAIQAAISILVFCETFSEDNGILKPKTPPVDITLPSEQIRKNGIRTRISKPARGAAYAVVQEIIATRNNGRRLFAEPLTAFSEELNNLGYGPFRLWWIQIVSEFGQASRQTSPIMVTVLAAALVEGALTFVVRHARSLNLPTFRSSDFDGAPNTWKIEKLVISAAMGGDAAILDHPTKMRAEGLMRTRQRIHAGRMLTDCPSGPVNLMPEEARDAATTAELVIGRVLEWLRKNPVPLQHEDAVVQSRRAM